MLVRSSRPIQRSIKTRIEAGPMLSTSWSHCRGSWWGDGVFGSGKGPDTLPHDSFGDASTDAGESLCRRRARD